MSKGTKKATVAAPALLGRDAILAAQDLPTRTVPVPEWGGAVRIRTLTGLERDAFDTETYEARTAGGRPTVRARLVMWCVVDADGNQLFTDRDLDSLAAKSGAVLDRLWITAQKLNGFEGSDDEEIEGN